MQLILLPGMDGTGMLFKPFIEKLPKNLFVTVIVYPSRDFLSFQELVSFVREKLPEREDFVVVAESFSGPVAYLIAQEPPKNLKAVVFVATFLHSPRPVLLKILSILPLEKMFSVWIPPFLAKCFLFGSQVEQEKLTLFKQSMKKVSGIILAKRLREIANLSFELKPICVHSIYIQATNDKLVPPINVEVFKKMCKDLKIFQVSGPHFILQTNPENCAQIVANETKN